MEIKNPEEEKESSIVKNLVTMHEAVAWLHTINNANLWIKKHKPTFMDYLTKYNANEKTIAYFKNEDETEDKTENENIENDDNKNQ